MWASRVLYSGYNHAFVGKTKDCTLFHSYCGHTKKHKIFNYLLTKYNADDII